MKQKFFAVLLLLCISVIFSCSDDKEFLPRKPVYLELDLTFRDKVLDTILGYKTFITPGKDFVSGKEYAGYGGVLVIRTTLNELHAFDLSCSNEAMPDTKVEVDKEGLHAICPQCGTKYEIGESGSGVAINAKKLRLTKYRTIQKDSKNWIVANNK